MNHQEDESVAKAQNHEHAGEAASDQARVEKAGHREVSIYIDSAPYSSPNPTTGSALYTLGSIPPGQGLFRDVEGNDNDKLVHNNEHVVHVREDEHFHSAPLKITIIVNTRKKDVHSETQTFDQIVALAFDPRPTGPNILITIMYEKGPHQNPEGTMPEGGTVWVKDGMIFHVTSTDKS